MYMIKYINSKFVKIYNNDILKFNLEKIDIKNSVIFGTLSSLLFTSYFHAFCLIQVVLILNLFFRFKSKIIKTLKTNIKYILSTIQ